MLLKRMMMIAISAITIQAAAIPQAAPAAANTFTFPAGGQLDGAAPLMLTWTPGNPGTVTIKLVKGPEGAQVDAFTVAVAISNSGSFSWVVPKEIQDSATMNGEKYALKITDDATQASQYSAPFDLSVPGSTFQAVAGQTTNPAATTPPAPADPAAAPSSSPVVPASSSVPAPAPSAASSAGESATPAPAAESTSAASSAVATGAAAATTMDTAATSTPTADDNNVSTSNSGDSSSAPSDDNPEDKKSSPNIGLIVGAVVGGIAGLALIGFGFVLGARLYRRHKMQKTIESARFQAALGNVEEEHEKYLQRMEQEEREQEERDARERAIHEYDQSGGMVNAF